MVHRNRCGKVNVKVLAILIMVTVALGTSLFAARQVRRNILSKTSLATGEAAFENKDWPVAFKSYRDYLGRNPDDLEVLKKYAQACLAIRPLDARAISGAIAAYRRVVQLDSQDEVAYEKLAMLYAGVGNFEELALIARMRLEHAPKDCKASLWLADALTRLNKAQEAEQILVAFIEETEALPDKHIEYVRACAKMSEIAVAGGSGDAKTKALEWLNRAVDHAPESVEALLGRARFYRQTSEIPGIDEKDRLGLARKDLEEADHRGTENPQIRLFLAAEWLAHGEYDRTAAELQAGEKFTQETLQEHFFDLNDWVVAKFLLNSEVATRKGATAEAAALADKTLESLTERRHRVQVLPSAILLYVAAGKAPEARQCLGEYLGMLRAQEGSAQSARRLAGLQALVAGAENRPYAVIDALAPVVGSDASNPELWRMLAEAYSRTDQTGRAVNALNQYHRLNPQDPQAMLELARQYSKLGDWKKAMEAAGVAESQDSTGLAPKVLRIGAAINLAVGQRGGVNTAELKKLSAELVDLHQANPDQVDIRMLQAIVASYLEQPEEVERQLRLAIEECSNPLRAEIQLAGHYLRAKRVKDAVAICEAACKRHPEVADPWLSLADVHVANADYGAARNCLKQGLSTVTEKREKRSLSIKLALLEVIHGDRATGTSLLREVAAQDPQEIQARLFLLGIRTVREDPATAEKLIGELKQAEGEGGLWWRLHQAALWLASEDWSRKQQDIAGLLRVCIDANPAWSAPVLLLSEMYERLGDVKRVEDTCRQALVSNPSGADIAGRLLTLLEKQGRFADAEKVLGQIAIDPRLISAWQIRIALGAGDFSRATDELKLRAASDDKDATSRIQLAQLVYQQTKDINQALKYLKEAEAITSDAQMLIAVKASILKAEGKTTEALQVLDDYVAGHNDFAAYWMRAVYLAQEGDLERAEKDYRKLTTLAQNSEAGYELLGNFYAGTKRLDQGIAAVEEGLGAHPENLRLKRNLMRMLFSRAQAKDKEKALEILTSLEAQLPQDAELLTIRAAQMLESPTPQSLAAAKAKLEDAVRLEPAGLNAHYALIGMAMREGQYKAACDYAVRALESNPKNPVLMLARARAELALGYAPMAVRLAREVLQQDPNSAEALGTLADSALGSGDRTLLQEARTTIEAAVSRNPKNETLLISRAHILSALGLPREAIAALETYCQTKEGLSSVTALVTMADLYRLAGDADKSKQKIEQAGRVDPNSQAVVHARLLWLVSQNRLEELRGISSAYISAKEQDPTMLLRAASVLAASNSAELKKEGLKLFEHAVALSPTSAEVRLGLASILYQTGDADRAQKIYQELLTQHPDNVRALNDLAWILQEHYQRYDAALELANKGLKLSRDDVHLLDTRGTILANLADRLGDAKNDFVRLTELLPADTPDRAIAFLRLGRICAQLNDLPQAKQHLQSALVIDRKTHIFTEGERSEITRILQQSEK
jgi:tetratricopeptide (TPR) repeat protein